MRKGTVALPLLTLVLLFLLVASTPAQGAFLSTDSPSGNTPPPSSSIVHASMAQGMPKQGITNLHASVDPSASASVNVFGAYTNEPAPMGIADYGINPSGAYAYSTNSSLGVVYIGSLMTQNSTGSKKMSVELNVNLQFSNNYRLYVYWIQNIAHIDTNVSSIVFLNNVWNFSVAAGSMSASAISGNGGVAKSGSRYFYSDMASSSLPGNTVRLAYPTTFYLEVNATVNSLKQPQVKFAYDNGRGWITYDTITFTSVSKLNALPGFVVNGINYNPAGLYYDSELVVGGPGGGSYITSDMQSDMRLQLEYWNGHNYQMVTTAYNFGSNTAEAMQNTISQFSYSLDNGGLFDQISLGQGNLRELYDPSQISTVDIKSPIASGTLYVKSALTAHAIPAQYPFVNGEVTVPLQPGYYELDVYKGSSLYSSGNFSITQGQSLKLQTPIGPVRLTMSYSVQGGGSGYSSPTLTYKLNGAVQTASIGTLPTVYVADPGSTWSVSYYLPGSSSTERWATNQTSGTALGSQGINLVYYHQFLVTLGYTLASKGTPPTPSTPSLSSTALGSPFVAQVSATSPTAVWIDNGAPYSITNPLGGSTSTERWEASSALTSGTISSPTTISLAYYHQFEYILSYSLNGGGNPPLPPTLSYVSVGSMTSSPISSSTSTTLWLDLGSSFSLTATIAGSSPQAERWQTNGVTSGTVSGPGTLSAVYYHQYLVSVSYAVTGGGTPSPPTFSYSSFGTGVSMNLGSASQSFWADSSPYAATNPLVGSTSTERWYAQSGNGTIIGPGPIALTYVHQFYLAINGGNLPSNWYQSGSTATVNPPVTFGRASGSGFRITAYTLDGAPAVNVSPTSGTAVSIQITMDAPHVLTFNSVTQYQVTLDSGAKSALNLITPPTISGDNYWYDAGSAVSVVLNGTWGRASGSGSRLVSYAINGGSPNSVASNGPVTVLSLGSIAAPQSIAATIVAQFQLKAESGSVSSMTSPPIPGDVGWYDQGSAVEVDYNYVWNVTAGQLRSNAVGYDIDGGAKSVLPRSGNGTFAVTTIMSMPHAVNIASTVQYRLSISGAAIPVLLSTTSPTGDAFYDSGSSLTATVPYTWGLVAGKSRQSLVSYTLDGQTKNVSRAESGNFTFTLSGPHVLAFNSVTQYLVTFRFADDSGSKQIVPTLIEIEANGKPESLAVPSVWLDNGTTFRLTSVVWQSVDVNPLDQTTYKVVMPSDESVRTRVYDVRVRVTDLLRLPVSGAQVKMVLANGTIVSRTTGNDGSVTVPLVPLGKFDATISYLGDSTQIRAAASQQAVTQVQIALSYADIGVPIAIAAVAVIAFLIFLRRRRISLRSAFRKRRWQSSGWDIGRRSANYY